MQHLFESILEKIKFQMQYFKDILEIFQTKQSAKEETLVPISIFEPINIPFEIIVILLKHEIAPKHLNNTKIWMFYIF